MSSGKMLLIANAFFGMVNLVIAIWNFTLGRPWWAVFSLVFLGLACIGARSSLNIIKSDREIERLQKEYEETLTRINKPRRARGEDPWSLS